MFYFKIHRYVNVNHCVVLQFVWPNPAGYWKLGGDFRQTWNVYIVNIFYENILNIVKTNNSKLIRVLCQSDTTKSGYVNVSWKR